MESRISLNIPSQQGLEILLQAFQEDFNSFAKCLEENFGRERASHFLQLLEKYGTFALNGGGNQTLDGLLSRATIDLEQAVLCFLAQKAEEGDLTVRRNGGDEYFVVSC